MHHLRAASRGGILLLASITLGALACTEGAPTSGAVTGVPGPQLATAATRAMKIRATVELVGPVVTPDPACLVAHLSSVIEGHATHLGRFHGVGSTCILSQIAPDPDPPFLPPGPPPFATASFSNPLWVLTAANGDELWLEAAEAVAVLSITDGSLRAEGTHTILGGTGRFAEATGELQSMAVNEHGQGPDDFRSEGWIRY